MLKVFCLCTHKAQYRPDQNARSQIAQHRTKAKTCGNWHSNHCSGEIDGGLKQKNLVNQPVKGR